MTANRFTQPTGICRYCDITILIPAGIRSKWPEFVPTRCHECSTLASRAHGGFVSVKCGEEFVIGIQRFQRTAEHQTRCLEIHAERVAKGTARYNFDGTLRDEEVLDRFFDDPRIKMLDRDPSQWERHSDGFELVTRCGRCGGLFQWRDGEICHETDEIEVARRRRTQDIS